MSDWPDSRTLGVVLYPGFDLLDVAGPLHAFGMLKNVFEPILVAEAVGPIESAQGTALVAEADFASCPALDILLVPGGAGSRKQTEDEAFLRWLSERGVAAELVLSVSAGAALLAKAGLLRDRQATTNARALAWVATQGPRTNWIRKARWVDDGDVVTAAGAAAGLDMALHVITRLTADDVGENVARALEHDWNRDASADSFG